ncbi:MAG TPA: RidA family protein [Alphaproteobacteria bacterium]|jgi:2-iminobutanoate/2-iminopropanoate deaminase|nr:RidA family protein [Alphaproteobacteria bacterium]
MKKKIINTKNAPAPIGPYNQAVKINNMLFVSGQVAINPKNNELIQSSISDETDQVMKNLSAILEEADMDFRNVVKTTIFLSNMSYFNEVNNIYGSYLKKGQEPARETVAVKTLPKEVNVEISMIAFD